MKMCVVEPGHQELAPKINYLGVLVRQCLYPAIRADLDNPVPTYGN
jgi:hypothetical protein